MYVCTIAFPLFQILQLRRHLFSSETVVGTLITVAWILGRKSFDQPSVCQSSLPVCPSLRPVEDVIDLNISRHTHLPSQTGTNRKFERQLLDKDGRFWANKTDLMLLMLLQTERYAAIFNQTYAGTYLLRDLRQRIQRRGIDFRQSIDCYAVSEKFRY